MFFRTKKSGARSYLQIVANHWRDGRPQQSVLATLGRLEELQGKGQVDALLTSGARFAQKLLVLCQHQQHQLPVIRARRWGAPLVFEKLWQETGCQAVLGALLRGRRYEFALERAVFLTVLHRLLAPGSDRAAERWKGDYVLAGVDGLELHHLYRAMAWLGQALPEDQQQGSSKLVPRSTKDVIEEHLFARRRDLERVQQVEVEHQGKHFLLRSELTVTAGKVLQAAGPERAPQLFGFGAGSRSARGVDGHAPKNIKMQVHFGSPMLGILPQSPQDHARGSSGVEWRP